MYQIDLIPTLIFVFVTTYTPGSNNIVSGSMGVLYGFKRTFPFLLGIASGFFIIMLLSGWVSSILNQHLPNFAPIVRILGAGYILYLAYGVYKNVNKLNQSQETKPLRYHNGVLLQFLNPKAIYYGLTISSTFLNPLLDRRPLFIVAAAILALVSLSSVSTWALGGNLIRRFLNTPQRLKVFGIILALALVYTALDLVGLFSLF